MDKNKLIYFAIGALLTLPSCSQEEPEDKPSADNNRIYFRSYLPSVIQSRAGVVTADNFSACQITCFNPNKDIFIDNLTGELNPYFADVTFVKNVSGRFHSQNGDELLWPDMQSVLHFFAFYPSAQSMREKVNDDSFFNLANRSTLNDGTLKFDYRLENFRIVGEIADQIDFVTAYASGSQLNNATGGISLDFKHQLARVELSAWGANDRYDFEIAGVRIGNPVTQGDFNLAASWAGEAYPWLNTSSPISTVEHIFSSGERVVRLDRTSDRFRSEEDAVSLMGSAGPIMVIPMHTRIEGWEGKADPNITSTPYSTDKLYFSVLLRVRNTDNELVYPYPNDRNQMSVVYFAINREGLIEDRLYNINGQYYTTPEADEDHRYIPDSSVSIESFGWAALPVAAKWDAGKIYSYKLNYSHGIGWHDPDDPDPGEPILERGKIPFNVVVSEWIRSEEDKSDINVPKH